MRDGASSPALTPSLALGFDFGVRRIGVAAGDTLTRKANPVGIVTPGAAGEDWPAIVKLIDEWRPRLLVVGIPYNEDGSESPMTERARAFARELGLRTGLEVALSDERYSSLEAEGRLREARRSGARPRRVRKEDVDRTAACIILERWLDRPPTDGNARMISQLYADGTLRHLLTLDGLDRRLIEYLIERAQGFLTVAGSAPPRSAALSGVTVANLFSEPSTRTRASFELAAKRLGAEVINLDVHLSSRVKGESMLDTIYTLAAMSIDVFVVRDAEAGVPEFVAAHVGPHVSVLSAGEAHVSHPTQGLLDALTIIRHKGRLDGLGIAIVGDIRHSRVARSAVQAFTTLGARDIRLVAPAELMPATREFAGCSRLHDIDAALAGADVVMMLRIQRERMAETDIPDAAAYFRRYGLSASRLARARPDAIVMHPGPMNRGVEIAEDVADGPQSVIREQVTNGVAIRMAVLEAVGGAILRSRRAG